MNGWMDGWMDRWMDIDRQIDTSIADTKKIDVKINDADAQGWFIRKSIVEEKECKREREGERE